MVVSAPGTSRVVVVGGGVVGLCCSYYAMRRGMRVTVLERGGPDGDSCVLGSAGMVVPSHVVPLAAPGVVALGVRMLFHPGGAFAVRPRASLDLLRWGWGFVRSATAGHVRRCAPVLRDLQLLSRREFIALDGDLAGQREGAAGGRSPFGLERGGLLVLCKGRHALAEEAATARLARDLGVPAEVLDPAGVASIETACPTRVAGGVFYPLDCHLDPGRFAAALRGALVAGGAEVRWGAEVAGWELDRGRVAAARLFSGENVAADDFVLAGGVWSPGLLRGLGIRLPMAAGKGYSVTLPSAPARPRICAILTEARVAVAPLGEALRVGGTMEIGGTQGETDPARVRGVLRAVPRYYPSIREDDFSGLEVWSGLRPCSADGMPYLGRFERFPNVIAATGHAMLGLSLGPATGLLVSELLAGDRLSAETGLLSPDRFGRR